MTAVQSAFQVVRMRGRVEWRTDPRPWRALSGTRSAAAAACLWALAPTSLQAQDSLEPSQDTLAPPQQKYGWVEVWGGSDVLQDVWLLYSGITLAPWSAHVYEQGWRLRSQAGYGAYDYTLEENGVLATHRGSVSYADALIGYHWRFGDLTAKTFAGIAVIDRKGRPAPEHQDIFTLAYGPKAVVELWLNLGDNAFTSLNLSYTTAHKTASARWRGGYRVWPDMAIGPELRFDTSDFKPQGAGGFFDKALARAGIFASYRIEALEVSIAGGLAANIAGSGLENSSPYATVNVLYQY